jgi:hypothetical protein
LLAAQVKNMMRLIVPGKALVVFSLIFVSSVAG